MTKNEFMKMLLVLRQRWDDQLREIDLTAPAAPSAPGRMSLRDVLYHVAWYEREMVGLLQSRTLAGSPWWELPTDERNALVLAEGQAVTQVEAYRLEQQAYAMFLELMEALTDPELDQAANFKDMPPDWHPWEVLAENTFLHYSQHWEDLGFKD
jgi:hypothetical protein